MKNFLLLTLLLLGNGCEPFVVEFPDLSTPKKFEATNVDSNSKTYQGGAIKVLTWNMRFGVGRFSFFGDCLLYTSPSPRDAHESRMPSSA